MKRASIFTLGDDSPNITVKHFGLKCMCAILLFMQLSFVGFAQQKNSDGDFKDWDYSPKRSYGIAPVANPQGKYHFHVTQTPTGATIQEIDAFGIVTKTSTVTYVNGKITTCVDVDRWGDTLEVHHMSEVKDNEMKVTRLENGKNSSAPCIGHTLKYDGELLAEADYFNYAGNPCTERSGRAIVKYDRFKDGNLYGSIKSRAFFDENGHPVKDPYWGCHKLVITYDDRGNETSNAYFDTSGAPTKEINGVYKATYAKDDNDHTVIKEYLDPNGKPLNSNYGVAKVVYEYKKNLLLKETRYDEKGNVMEYNEKDDVIPIYKYKRDANGNLLEKACFDKNEKPVSDIHKHVYKFDASGSKTDDIFFGKNGRPTTNDDGVHHYKYTYDSKGRNISTGFYGLNERPVRNTSDLVYMVKLKWDNQSRIVSRSYWMDENTKMNRWDGFAEETYKFDSLGNIIEQATLDQRGQLQKTETGYSIRKMEIDNQGQQSSVSWFSGTEPVELKKGNISAYHSIKYTYKDDKVISLEYFDTKGKQTNAILALDGTTLAHKVDFIYKGNDLITEKIYTINSDVVTKTIDCKSENTIATSGIRINYHQ